MVRPDWELSFFGPDAELIGHMSVDSTITQGQITKYAVVLVFYEGERQVPIRVYDNAHGQPEMHRTDRNGWKIERVFLPHESPAKAMNAAIAAILENHREMIDSWLRQ